MGYRWWRRNKVTHFELCQDLYQLSRIHRGKRLANHVQGRRSGRNGDALRKGAEEGGFVFGTVWVSIPFGILTFTPLGASFATVNELTAYGCLALEKRVRISQVDSEWSTPDIHIIEIADSRESSLVICG
jgi:hypothetical protein